MRLKMTSGISINDPGRSLEGAREAAGEWRPGDPTKEQAAEVREAGRSADFPALSVGEIMTPNARSCRPDDTLAAAAMAMCEADCRFLPVVDEAGRPIAVVTDGDICLLGSTSHRRLSDMFVRDAMSGPPATCRSGDDVLDAVRVMRERRIRHLPVVGSEGVLEGVLSLTDIVLKAEENGSPVLRREVSAAIREILQKRGTRRSLEHNPFFED
jgi:CBS domain-containing protein